MKWWMLAAGAILVACTQATQPDRPPPYEFAIDCGDSLVLCSERAGDLQITFRWPTASLPVRFWVEPVGELPRHVSNAIRTWMSASIYGEFSGAFVRDSQFADVIVTLGASQSFTRAPQSENAALNCRGQTNISIGLDTAIALPFRVFLHPRAGASEIELNECLAVMSTHEIGHSLGLFLHTDDPADVMFAQPTNGVLSARDRSTFAWLYHSRPTVRLPAGR